MYSCKREVRITMSARLGLHKLFQLFPYLSEVDEDLQWQRFPSVLIDCMKTLKGNLKALQKHQKHSDTFRLQQRRVSGEKAFPHNVSTSSDPRNAPEYVQVCLPDLKSSVKVKMKII